MKAISASQLAFYKRLWNNHVYSIYSALMLILFAGCVAYPADPRYQSSFNSRNIHNTGYGSDYRHVNPGQVRQANYQYYPRYGTYYCPQTRMYSYQQGHSWHDRSSPPFGVSQRQLRSSPYVPLNLHGNPSLHHSSVVQRYPRQWAPPGGNRNQNQNFGSFSSNPHFR